MKKCILISMLLFSWAQLFFAMDPETVNREEIFEGRLSVEKTQALPAVLIISSAQKESANETIVQRLRRTFSELFRENTDESPGVTFDFEQLLRSASGRLSTGQNLKQQYHQELSAFLRSNASVEEDWMKKDPAFDIMQIDKKILLQDLLVNLQHQLVLTEEQESTLTNAYIQKLINQSYVRAITALQELKARHVLEAEKEKKALLEAYAIKIDNMNCTERKTELSKILGNDV